MIDCKYDYFKCFIPDELFVAFMPLVLGIASGIFDAPLVIEMLIGLEDSDLFIFLTLGLTYSVMITSSESLSKINSK